MNPTRYLLTLTLCVSFFVAYTQEIYEITDSETKIIPHGNSDNYVSRGNANNITKRISLSFAERDNCYHFLTDSNFKVLRRYISPITSYDKGGYDVIAQKSNNDTFYNYLRKPGSNTVYIEENNYDVNGSFFKEYLKPDKNERIVAAFNQSNRLFFLTFIGERKTFRLYEDGSDKVIDIVLQVPDYLADIDWERTFKSVKVISKDKNTDLEMARSKAKLYPGTGNEFYITLDDSLKYTVLLSINYENRSATTKVFYKQNFYCNQVINVNSLQHNSYLFEGKLFQLTFCPNDMLIEIKNVATDSALVSFHAAKDSIITFASTEISKNEVSSRPPNSIWSLKYNSNTSNKKDLRAKDFFRAINAHELSLTVERVGDKVVLKIGEAHENSVSGGGYAPGGFSAGGGFSGGGYVSSSYSFHTQSETFFKTIMKNPESPIILFQDVMTKSDKLKNFDNNAISVATAISIFSMSDKLYYFFWSTTGKKLAVAEFD